jgi:hypothetical protein
MIVTVLLGVVRRVTWIWMLVVSGSAVAKTLCVATNTGKEVGDELSYSSDVDLDERRRVD